MQMVSDVKSKFPRMCFRVAYKNRIYIVTVQPTDEVAGRMTKKRVYKKRRNKIDPVTIKKAACKYCGDLELNGVCMAHCMAGTMAAKAAKPIQNQG